MSGPGPPRGGDPIRRGGGGPAILDPGTYMCPVLGTMVPPPRGWVVVIPVDGQGHGIPYGMACFRPECSWKSLWSSPVPSRTSQ